MQVRAFPLLGWLLVACAAPADRSPPAPPRSPPPVAAAAPAVEPAQPAVGPSTLGEPTVPEVDGDAAFEQQRRRALVEAADPTVAALELAGWLAAGERHEEALAVVNAAWRRNRAPALMVAAAGLQRDLGRRHEAVATLQAVVTGQTFAGCHPGLLFELADLQWLEGDGPAATATLRAIEATHGRHHWWTERQADVRALHREIARGGAPRAIAVRDVLGNLRGAPAPAERLRSLRELIAIGAGPRAQAVAIGVGDGDELVRAQAVLAAELEVASLLELCRGALGDAAPQVRAAGAARCRDLEPDAALPLLWAALRHEDDPAPLLALHQSLHGLRPDGPTATVAELATAVGRQQLRQAWEARWAR
ncbi:MAG: hypothetical protein IPK26_29265 [Planctomycetes bacterium]|nr:hypothetical protein [Planctomycetota bacterium]